MGTNATNQKLNNLGIDAELGHRLIEVKIGVSGLRSVRLGLMQLAYALVERPQSEGYLVLSQVAITRERLLKEWEYAAAVASRGNAGSRMVPLLSSKKYTGSSTGYPASLTSRPSASCCRSSKMNGLRPDRRLREPTLHLWFRKSSSIIC